MSDIVSSKVAQISLYPLDVEFEAALIEHFYIAMWFSVHSSAVSIEGGRII